MTFANTVLMKCCYDLTQQIMHHVISTNKLVSIGVYKVSVILFLGMKRIYSQLSRNAVGISNDL